MQKLVPQLSGEFDVLCQKVHEAQQNQEEWLSTDTITDALDDLARLANNARYTYMRVRLLQERLRRDKVPLDQEDFTRDGD